MVGSISRGCQGTERRRRHARCRRLRTGGQQRLGSARKRHVGPPR